jgi:hypothetical protein
MAGEKIQSYLNQKKKNEGVKMKEVLKTSSHQTYPILRYDDENMDNGSISSLWKHLLLTLMYAAAWMVNCPSQGIYLNEVKGLKRRTKNVIKTPCL